MPGQLGLGPATPDGGGGTNYQVWSIHLAAGPPCTLWGAPQVRLRDTTGKALPFPVTDHPLGSGRPDHPGPVLVDARHSPEFALAKYRCDTTIDPPGAASVLAMLPFGAGTLTGSVPAASMRLAFCPHDGGDQRIHVGAIGGWQTSPPPPHRVAVSMHSSFLPPGTPTWGRAHLGGDGRADTVIVHPDGHVVMKVGRRMVRARLPGHASDRLQGFADLTGDGRPEILVGSSATGCDNGYRLCDTVARVLTVHDGRLRVVQFPDGEPEFDLGVGLLTTGWACDPGGPVESALLLNGTGGYRLTRTRYRVSGLVAHRVWRAVTTGVLSGGGLDRLTATRCPGLTALGWAWERPRATRPLT